MLVTIGFRGTTKSPQKDTAQDKQYLQAQESSTGSPQVLYKLGSTTENKKAVYLTPIQR